MRICLVSLSQVAVDPRLQKQTNVLADAGHDVVLVGYKSSSANEPPDNYIVFDAARPKKRAKFWLAFCCLLGQISHVTAKIAWSLKRDHRILSQKLKRIEADLFIANDWNALPGAAYAAKSRNARLAYDSHELGIEEHLERSRWRLLFPRYIRNLESQYLPSCEWVSTVSAGIAERIAAEYGLSTVPTVVRNAPSYETVSFRPAEDEIEVLFHGGFAADRNLIDLVRSVSDWKPNVSLVLRGWGDNDEVDTLATLISNLNVGDRVKIEPRVDRAELVQAASLSDIGIHPLLPITNQLKYAMPNKFFEYIMAGLAVMVHEGTEMADVIREYDIGMTFQGSEPGGIANAINGLSKSEIDKFKRNSLEAAKQLNANSECQKWISLVNR